MKIIKTLFIGLGVIFLLIIGVVVLLTGARSDFKEKHQEFVKEISREFSQTWEVSSISEHMTNDMLALSRSPNGVHALNVFKSMGEINRITDLEIGNYSTHSDGPSVGVFTFKAEFQNGKGLVTVTVQELNDKAYLHGFNIDPIGDAPKPKEFQA